MFLSLLICRLQLLAMGKTDTVRAWGYVREDAPFGEEDPAEALFRYSRNGSGVHLVEHLRAFMGFLADAAGAAEGAGSRRTGPTRHCGGAAGGRQSEGHSGFCRPRCFRARDGQACGR